MANRRKWPTAIAEHYQPRGAGDALPATKAGLAVALADRLDTITGIFAIGQKPSGTKDPFALRRAAIGIGRMIFEHRLPLDLLDLIDAALHAHTVFESTPPKGKTWPSREAVAAEVYDYLMERQRNAWLEPPDGGPPIAGHHAGDLRCGDRRAAAFAAGFRRARARADRFPGAAGSGRA